MFLTRAHPLLSLVGGMFALVAGILVLLGWGTHTSIFLRPDDDAVATVVGSALCLALGGLALIAPGRPSMFARRVPQTAGILMVGISVGMLVQIFLGLNLGINLPALHAQVSDGNPYPGRMSPSTALSFLLMGVGLWLEPRGQGRPWIRRFLGYCAGIPLFLGLIGLLAHFVHPELLFGWGRNLVRMAPYTSVTVLVLGLGLSAAWRAQESGQADGPDGHRRRIFLTAALALTVVALVTGTVGFTLQLNNVTQRAQEYLSRTLSDRRLMLEEALSNASQKALLVSHNPVVMAHLATPWRQASPVNHELTSMAESLLPLGFSYVAFERMEGESAFAGQSIGAPILEVPLKGFGSVSLAWKGGYVVRHRLPIQSAQGLAGYLVTEQPLRVLESLSSEVARWGDSFDMALCAEHGDQLVCFPQRLRREWFKVPKTVKGQPLPMTLALGGQTGVTARLDFRQRQVVAAYAPLGHSGLGMVLKVDSEELYAPARRQFLVMVPMIVLIVLAGLWALRLRLRPMVHALVRARQAAQANEARFVAAMESSLDSFYILKAERDAAGVVIDFRFTYVTARGAALISRTPADVEGQLLCELLPVNRTGGFFDKYKAVLDSGFSLAEEFPIHEDGVVASWLSHQVVKLGDDSIAITTRDISARKHDEQALQQSEERLRMVTDSVPALIAYLDMDERYLFINRGGAELYGLAVHDIVGKTVFEVVGSENYALMKPHIEVVRAGYPVTYEREVLRPNGVRHVLTSYLPRYDDQGVVTNVCALGHDITERKQMEAALAVSQESLKAVTDNVPALISYIDREHRFRFANLAYQAWLGVDPASLIGRSLGELYGEAAFAKIRPYLDRALAGETLSYERELEARDGVRHVHATMTPHRNSGGDVVGLYVLMNDITPLKRAEQKSALSEERLTMALDGSHLALFDWSVTTNQVYHSAHWSSMLGGPAQETTTSLQSLSQLVHPDDLPVVLAKLSGALKGSIPFYSAEHRVRTSAGEWLWILSRGRVVERDADGRALRLSGTNADISEQKRIEAQLQRMVEIDALTGLPNRVLFNDRLHRALDRVHLKGKPMALMLLDIDFFKQINDGMGHDAGDAVLQEFAHRLASTVRQTDTVARLGGDEFTIILEELHTPLEAELVAAKILAAMKDDFIYAGQFMRVTTSIGVAYQDQPLDDPAKLIKRADQALYSAKAAGRNGYRCAEPPAVA